MHREGDIVPPHRILLPMVPLRVLRLDERGKVEEGGGEGVAGEAEDVEGGERRGGAGCAAATEVEQRLWVEGQRPGQSVDPAEDAACV